MLKTSQVQSQQIMVVEPCGVCGEQGHGANVCPRYQELAFGDDAQVNALQSYQQGQQFRPKFDPYSNSYNPGWRHHPHFSWNQSQHQEGTNQGFQFKEPQQQPMILNRNFPPPPPPQKSSFEESMQAYVQSNQERVDSIEASMKRIETQVSQLADSVGELLKREKKGKLPSQPEQAHAVTVLLCDNEEDEVDEEIIMEEVKSIKAYTPPIPFPSRLIYEKQGDGRKKVAAESMETITQHNPPLKQRDPGSFSLSISFGNGKEASGMLDLGAGVNLMSLSLFRQMKLGKLKLTCMRLQFADGSIRCPEGIIEDVLVRVSSLLVSIDFVVLDMGDENLNGEVNTLLLGRPFMATTNTLIDFKKRMIELTVLGETVSFSARDSNTNFSATPISHCFSITALDLSDKDVVLQKHVSPHFKERDSLGKQVWRKKVKQKVETKGGGACINNRHGNTFDKHDRLGVEDGDQKFPPHPPDRWNIWEEELWLMSTGSKLLDSAWFD